MEKMIQTFFDIMNDEKDIYKILLDLSMQKKGVIIQNQLATLNSIIQQETELVNKIRRFEKMRAINLQEIAVAQNAEGEIFSIDEIISLADGRLKEELINLKREFGGILSELTRYNALNRKLIYTHLEYTSFCINLLSRHANVSDTYDRRGCTREEKMTNIRLFDQKV